MYETLNQSNLVSYVLYQDKELRTQKVNTNCVRDIKNENKKRNVVANRM
jgi:hypothetical protein